MSGATVWAQGFQPQLKLDAKKPQCKPGNKACGGACIPESHECLVDKLKTSLAQKAVGLAALGVAGYIGTRPNAGKFQKGAALAVGALGVGLGAKGVQNFLQVRETVLKEHEIQTKKLKALQEQEALILANEITKEKELSSKKEVAVADYIISKRGVLHDKKTTETLVSYTMSKHHMINGCLRKTYPALLCKKKEMTGFVSGMDKALSLLPKNSERADHWRGAITQPDSDFAKAIANLKVGSVIRDPGYSSYSAEKRVAENFSSSKKAKRADDILVRFRTNSSNLTDVTDYSMFGSAEAERVLPRGIKQRVTSIDTSKENGHLLYIISLEDA